jgi:hypothetical protein
MITIKLIYYFGKNLYQSCNNKYIWSKKSLLDSNFDRHQHQSVGHISAAKGGPHGFAQTWRCICASGAFFLFYVPIPNQKGRRKLVGKYQPGNRTSLERLRVFPIRVPPTGRTSQLPPSPFCSP